LDAKIDNYVLTRPNLFGDIAVIGEAELYKDLMYIKLSKKADPLPKYVYPENVLTVSNLHKLVIKGISITFHKSEVAHISQLDCQKKHNKSLFGNGFLMSNVAIKRKAEAEAIIWELSDRERAIIEKLNEGIIK
jgi:hypothetical protein